MKNSQKTNIIFWVAFFLLITVLFTLIAFGQQSKNSPVKNPIPMSDESIQRGKEVFFESCSGCHGRRADGRGLQALNLNPKPQNLRNPQFVKYLTDERMYTSISGGVRGTSMPAFEGMMVIPKEDRWHVINYIRSLTADDTLNLPNSIDYQMISEDVKNIFLPNDEASNVVGKNLYHNYCSSCHGSDGGGNGILAPNLTPTPRNLVVVTSWGEKPFIEYLSDARLFDSITNGVPGTSMLPWIGVFTDEDRWHIINYLRSEGRKLVQKIEQAYQ
jgi:mono/diheme cytochrome c family protein